MGLGESFGLDSAEWRSEEENLGMKVCELYTTSLN
jgi:hypothetical protein